MDNNQNFDMNDLDFNVSGQGGFQANQNIMLGDPNPNPNDLDNNDNKENNINENNIPSNNNEKLPTPYGVVNVPNSKEENINQNIIITQETQEPTKSTLDEPITTTLKRDLLVIGNKIRYVLVPKMTERKLEELYNWDLWGPLLFCFLYSIALSTGENKDNENSIFVLIFVIFWIGGFVITFNGRFLGAQIGICQMISLLGYAMFPITVGGIVIGFCRIINIIVKLIIVIISLIWACLASIGFIGGLVEPDKKFIAVFPVFIFLLSLSMFALNY